MWLLLAALACETNPPGGDGGAVTDGGSTSTADGGTADGGSTDGGSTGPVEWSDGVDGEVVAAARADLRLKRWRQLSLDLEGALELTADEICREAGLYDCTELHVVPLGGVSVPNGLYRPIDTVSATTGLASERLVMQACWNRGKLDHALVQAGEEAVVFGHLELLSSEADDAELSAQVGELYRRLLARDPVEEEVAALVGLHATVLAQGGRNADWALLACFSIGTLTEALTY